MTDDTRPDKSASQLPAIESDVADESRLGSPPSIVPLVLVPLLMVAAFVVVVALFGWLGLAGARPEELVARLQRADRNSFRAAVALVQMLREPENAHLRRDEQLARQLSGLLQHEVATGNLEPERIQLRSFLCRALGEFEGDEVLYALLDAGATERDPREIDVRRSAFEAIAQIASRRSAEARPLVPGLLETLLAATQAPSAEPPTSPSRDSLRATAAFTLGVLGDDRAQTALLNLLDDPCADVRFNAATGLARWGRFESERVLLEMLDPESESAVAGEGTERGRAWRRQIVLRSALRSVELLWTTTPPNDSDRLYQAVLRLTRYSDDPAVQRQARRIMQAVEASQQSTNSVCSD
ncbi:MAG: HEAT repeat domain-containing protein [Pirellulaceae bacterium]|nr:HEAT repeat domain-containing protein [Pirellulaceae bacterium]